jgi:hypothetical protein
MLRAIPGFSQLAHRCVLGFFSFFALSTHIPIFCSRVFFGAALAMQNVGEEAALYCLDGLVLFQIGSLVSADDSALRWSILISSICTVLWSFGTVDRAFAALARVAHEASFSLTAASTDVSLELLAVQRLTEVTHDGKVGHTVISLPFPAFTLACFGGVSVSHTRAGVFALPVARSSHQRPFGRHSRHFVPSGNQWCHWVSDLQEPVLLRPCAVRSGQVCVLNM